VSKGRDFSSLPLSEEMLLNLQKLGFSEMTPVQAQSLPYILQGDDVIAQAKTGSGKTAAFGIGVLSNLDVKNFKPQSLIITPTRELAEQVAAELRNIAKFRHNIKVTTLCGGVAFGPQMASMRHGAHIVVGTPGRVLQHLKKGTLNLETITSLVLDEADRMLDMGFIEEIENVISYAPSKRQTLLFSATFPDEIVNLAKSIQKNPISIKTTSTESANRVEENFYKTPSSQKFTALMKILSRYKPDNAIIFCNTKNETKDIALDLRERNVDALAIHGDLEQYERVDVLVQFINKSCSILVATDVAARGLDIKELAMVVNYDLPRSLEDYTHRIGRTARAGNEGIAITLVDEDEIEKIEEFTRENSVVKEIDEFKIEKNFALTPKNVTIVIEGGKKNKIRAGDILGALTKDAKIDGGAVGKIDVYDKQSYVAIKKEDIKKAYEQLKNSKIKGKNFSIWVLE